jgi:hypothetical protein
MIDHRDTPSRLSTWIGDRGRSGAAANDDEIELLGHWNVHRARAAIQFVGGTTAAHEASVRERRLG